MRFSRLIAAGGLLLVHSLPVSAQAPSPQLDKRVGALESQMRAVQRQVFPGGDKRYFGAEVTPEPVPPPAPAGTPATAPLVDLTQRVEALESQARTLTGQVEQMQFQMRQLESAMTKLRGDAEFRLDALEGKSGPADAAGRVGAALPTVSQPTAEVRVPAAPALGKPASGKPAGGPGAADTQEAAYLAGYALYKAGDYPAAARALADFVAANPKHARASNAQFWAGRSLLAQGDAAPAAKAFLSGYQTYPRGERAHNSLLWLGKALIQMKQPKAACQALDQLRTAYPERLVGQFGGDAEATRAAAKCGA